MPDLFAALRAVRHLADRLLDRLVLIFGQQAEPIAIPVRSQPRSERRP